MDGPGRKGTGLVFETVLKCFQMGFGWVLEVLEVASRLLRRTRPVQLAGTIWEL